jgi:hypothetical protein
MLVNNTLKLRTPLPPTRPAFVRGAAVSSKPSRPLPSSKPVSKFSFYFIWAIDHEQAPKRRHADLVTVTAEVRRLRALAPEKIFVVFEAREVEGV